MSAWELWMWKVLEDAGLENIEKIAMVDLGTKEVIAYSGT